MSKLSFRSRQVDYQKPLPIYLNHDLPDLQDFAAINRSVPQMPTGMEKDEEAEHHLQRALSALQAFGANGASSTNEYAIPTPKVEIDNKMYESIYNMECPKQKQYIRIQPFSNDQEYPDYDADFEDEHWLNQQIKSLPSEYTNTTHTNDITLFFENIMDRLEKITSHSMQESKFEEAKFLLMKEINSSDNDQDLTTTNSCSSTAQSLIKSAKDQLILNIYEYWKAKRLKLNHPLTPIVLTDKSGVLTAPNNPYLVFRRRTEKMQTRKKPQKRGTIIRKNAYTQARFVQGPANPQTDQKTRKPQKRVSQINLGNFREALQILGLRRRAHRINQMLVEAAASAHATNYKVVEH